jgi:hypothetical protein
MINIPLVLITTSFYKEEKYILSLREDSIDIPILTIENYNNLDNQINNYISDYIFQDKKMSSFYVKPVFIGINNENICKLYKDSDTILYFLYGCVCPKLLPHNGYFWKTFDIYDQNILTELSIINEVIEHSL